MAWQWDTLSESALADIAKAFYIGLRFDGRIAIFMALPLALCLFFPYLSRYFAHSRKVLLIIYAIIFTAYIFIYIVDFAHYAYLQTRLNVSTLALLEDTREAFGMVYSSYPVIRLVLVLIVTVAAMLYCAKKIMAKWTYTKPRKLRQIISGLVALFITLILIYGQYGIVYYQLRWSEAYFSGKNDITALGLNPIQNLIDTLPQNNINDNTQEAKAAYENIVDYLKVQNINKETLSYDRFYDYATNETQQGAQPNIVIIVIESMSTHKSSLMFNELDSTPFLRDLSERSLYFPNYYANARTTARAMFSIITGITDVGESFKTSSRDPNAVDQKLVWDDFSGYEKLYMIGGNANWANIRGIITNNVDGVKVYEEGFWKSPRLDVWGISDLDLLQEANELLSQQKTPFISLIQLSTLHSPFSVPPGIADFDYTMPDDEYLKRYGFVNKPEYLAMKFCDYAIKKYFEIAQKSNYYENTIFILTGDHGMGEPSPSAGTNYQNIRLHEFQVPLIIHSPKRFPRGEILYQSGGHIDIFPTAAHLAGVKIQNTTMGRDLLDSRFGDDRFTFIRRLNRPPIVLNRHFAYSSEFAESGGGVLYKRENDDMYAEWIPAGEAYTDLAKTLETLVQDIFQSSLYMIHHNTKAKARQSKAAFEHIESKDD